MLTRMKFLTRQTHGSNTPDAGNHSHGGNTAGAGSHGHEDETGNVGNHRTW